MTPQILLAFLTVALIAAGSAVTYLVLAGVRPYRRASWEFDRADWRKWMFRL